jgi:Tfp pilus assembly ATPase PilU
MAVAASESLRFTMDELLKLTVERGASDLHLTVGLPPMLRISGKLIPTEYRRLMPDDTKRLVYSILNDKQKERFDTILRDLKEKNKVVIYKDVLMPPAPKTEPAKPVMEPAVNAPEAAPAN